VQKFKDLEAEVKWQLITDSLTKKLSCRCWDRSRLSKMA